MMALERVPADIRRDGGVARMSDPKVTVVDNGLYLMMDMLTENQGDNGGRYYSGDGKSSYWPFCRSSDP